jgi:hypothetical protein
MKIIILASINYFQLENLISNRILIYSVKFPVKKACGKGAIGNSNYNDNNNDMYYCWKFCTVHFGIALSTVPSDKISPCSFRSLFNDLATGLSVLGGRRNKDYMQKIMWKHLAKFSVLK